VRFYTVEWIKGVLDSYKKGDEAFYIEDKGVNFEPKYFLLAVLHIYHKNMFPFFEDIINLEDLVYIKKHQEFDFMYLVDLLRKEFAYWFKENLLFRDFSEENYLILAQEFLLLEEQVRKQIQIPLLDQIKKLTIDLEEIVEENKDLNNFDEKKFLRLFKFFSIVEKLEKSLCSKLIERAKEVAKKAYKENYEKKFNFSQSNSFSLKEDLKKVLKEKLKEEVIQNLNK